jgi:ADP-ribose pyrophosphatase YjhB (NUDIX family)
VGAIVRDDDGRVLLVRRGTDPGRGLWSVPGGRVEAGETAETATAREVQEETGLLVSVGSRAGVVERAGPAGVVYVIEDFHARPAPGADLRAVRAGDDADEVGWYSPDELMELDCVAGLVDAFRAWAIVP